MTTSRARITAAAGCLLGIGVAFAAAVPASAATATCEARNTTSSSVHTLTEDSSETCYRVQARAERYYSSGAHETAYGPSGSVNSTVYATPGVSLSAYAGRAQPVSSGPWDSYVSFTTTSTTKTFSVTV